LLDPMVGGHSKKMFPEGSGGWIPSFHPGGGESANCVVVSDRTVTPPHRPAVVWPRGAARQPRTGPFWRARGGGPAAGSELTLDTFQIPVPVPTSIGQPLPGRGGERGRGRSTLAPAFFSRPQGRGRVVQKGPGRKDEALTPSPPALPSAPHPPPLRAPQTRRPRGNARFARPMHRVDARCPPRKENPPIVALPWPNRHCHQEPSALFGS